MRRYRRIIAVTTVAAGLTHAAPATASTGFDVRGVHAVYRLGSVLAVDGTAAVTVSADITNDASGLCAADWSRWHGGFPYPVVHEPLGNHLRPFVDRVAPGSGHGYFVDAASCSGAADTGQSPERRYGVDDETGSVHALSGGWTHPASAGAYGGSVYRSSRAGASLSWGAEDGPPFWDGDFALVANTPSTGSVKIYVDGALAATVPLRRPARSVSYVSVKAATPDSIRVVVAAGTVQIDAMLHREAIFHGARSG